MVCPAINPFRGLLSLAGSVVLLSPLWGADVPEVAAQRLEGRIQVDGVLNEPAWRGSPEIANFI